MQSRITMQLIICVFLVTSLVSLGSTTCHHNHKDMSVDCSGLNLTEIPKNIFDQKIQILILSNNRLGELNDGAFENYTGVESLIIDVTRLRTIERSSFKELTSLRDLDLSDNHITRLRPETFQSNTNLKSLDLKNNSLRKWLAETSEILKSNSLEVLDLRHCQLASIHKDGFLGLPKLDKLNLADNLLHELPATLLDSLPSLTGLYLRGNEWICGPWLKHLLEKHRSVIKNLEEMECTDDQGRLQQVTEYMEVVGVKIRTVSSSTTTPEMSSTTSSIARSKTNSAPSIAISVTKSTSSSPRSSLTLIHVLLLFIISYGMSHLYYVIFV